MPASASNDRPTTALSLFFDFASLQGDLRINDQTHPLIEMALISLFTWRRAEPGDIAPEDDPQGWWGDSVAAVQGDRIGSRLWLLQRRKITPETQAFARDLALQALAWMLAPRPAGAVDAGAAPLARSVNVSVSRLNLEGLALDIEIVDRTGELLRFAASHEWGR
jgi:phage gp46-like protein